jgi:hypothetical protein
MAKKYGTLIQEKSSSIHAVKIEKLSWERVIENKQAARCIWLYEIKCKAL